MDMDSIMDSIIVTDGVKVGVSKVGRRWWQVAVAVVEGGKIVEACYDIEATYSEMDKYWPMSKNHGKRNWTLTGEGSRKYRKQIVEFLNNWGN